MPLTAGHSTESEPAAHPTPLSSRAFRFDRDTFPFANELVWQYRVDPATGKMKASRNARPPEYTHRCFVMVRSARQFHFHARFDAALPEAKPAVYRELIRRVVSRTPRRPSAESKRILIPGYPGLRAFANAHGNLLKDEIGGPLQSYFVRSHWRMVFPTPPWHQRAIVRQLSRGVSEGLAPVIHLFRFPHVTINHGIVLFGLVESDETVTFEAYDPNIPDQPVSLIYHRATANFSFPPTCYWAGGVVSVTHIYSGLLY